MEQVLNATQVRQFIESGFVRIDNAFPRELADDIRRILWKDTNADPDDPASWTMPVVRLGMYDQPPFVASANTEVLHHAFDQLVGSGRWIPCRNMGTFPIRFPSDQEPPDTGWHVDASFGDDPANFSEWRVNWRSRNRGLLMLFLYSDIGENDAPTRIRVGSHLDVAKMLKPEGERGLAFMDLAHRLSDLPVSQETVAAGRAGTVYLCHPFLMHAAQPHRGGEPRFLAQPPLLLNTELMQEANRDHFSLVEIAIQLGIGG